MKANLVIVLLASVSSLDLISSAYPPEHDSNLPSKETSGDQDTFSIAKLPHGRHICRNLTAEEKKQTIPHFLDCCSFPWDSLDNARFADVVESCTPETSDESTEVVQVNFTDGDERNDDCLLVACVLDSYGLLNENKRLNLERLKQLLASELEGSELKGSEFEKDALSASDFCLSNPPMEIGGPESCFRGLRSLFSCILQQIFVKCPDDIWNSDKACNWMKNRYESCPGSLIFDISS